MSNVCLPDPSALVTSLKLKGRVLANRFVMPSMSRGWCIGGKPPPAMADYYRRRVEGGVQLIISEGCVVDHRSSTSNASFARLTPDTIKSWALCVRAVQDAGGCFLMQLTHEGALRIAAPGVAPSISPSGLAAPDKPNGLPATISELAEVREAFIKAALCAHAAGADGVELHGCHGFLLDQFLWRETNRRTDCYGGADIASRARFPAEIVAGIRHAIGDDFIIAFRFSQWKEADYGATIVDSPQELEALLSVLRTAGTDIFHVSTRRFSDAEWPGSDRSLAGWTRSLTDVPVVTVGSVGLNIDVMQTLLGTEEASFTGLPAISDVLHRFEREEFDLIAIGRSLIGDPDWVRKVQQGRYGDITAFTREYIVGGLEWEILANGRRADQAIVR